MINITWSAELKEMLRQASDNAVSRRQVSNTMISKTGDQRFTLSVVKGAMRNFKIASDKKWQA